MNTNATLKPTEDSKHFAVHTIYWTDGKQEIVFINFN
jgi:hypothetical protein